MLRKPALFVLLAASSLSFAQTNPAGVLMMPKPEPVPAKAGATVEVKLPVQLREGYHVNSNMPPDPYLIPLKLSWDAGPFTAFEVVYPKPILMKLGFSPTPLPVFSGKLELTTRFKVATSVPPVLVNHPGNLRHPSSNHRIGLPPRATDLILRGNVSQ